MISLIIIIFLKQDILYIMLCWTNHAIRQVQICFIYFKTYSSMTSGIVSLYLLCILSDMTFILFVFTRKCEKINVRGRPLSLSFFLFIQTPTGIRLFSFIHFLYFETNTFFYNDPCSYIFIRESWSFVTIEEYLLV
jgi:hypothetical protein